MSDLVTIAVHGGHVVAQRHNRRDPAIVRAEHHIDPNGVHENWFDIDERDAYAFLFDDAQEAYNAKQKRKDRKIEDYYASIREPYDAIRNEQLAAQKWNDEHREEIKRGEMEARPVPEIPRSMKKPSYELIVGVYRKEQRFRDDGTPETDKDGSLVYDTVPFPAAQAKPILQQYFSDWQARNPHLHCFGCYYHADEQGEAPHLHIDYIPVADGYKRGMERQNGLDRALQQQGFASDGMTATALERWTQSERDILEEITSIYGFEVIHPQAGKGARHKTKEELHREGLERENELLQQKITEKSEQVAALDERISRLRSVSAQASGEAFEERMRRDKAKLEADRLTRVVEQETVQAQSIREKIKQSILDYRQTIEDLRTRFEADGSLLIKRALQALRYIKIKNQPAIDYFADYYIRNQGIPRIPEDEATEKARRGIGFSLLDNEEINHNTGNAAELHL